MRNKEIDILIITKNNPAANNTAAARRPAAAGLLGVRYTRFAHSAHPHCARRRTFAYAQVRSFRRAQRQPLGTLGAIFLGRIEEEDRATSCRAKNSIKYMRCAI